MKTTDNYGIICITCKLFNQNRICVDGKILLLLSLQTRVGIQPPPNTAWHTCRKLIYVPRSAQKGFPVGFWPIPESFWPDATGTTLVRIRTPLTISFIYLNNSNIHLLIVFIFCLASSYCSSKCKIYL